MVSRFIKNWNISVQISAPGTFHLSWLPSADWILNGRRLDPPGFFSELAAWIEVSTRNHSDDAAEVLRGGSQPSPSYFSFKRHLKAPKIGPKSDPQFRAWAWLTGMFLSGPARAQTSVETPENGRRLTAPVQLDSQNIDKCRCVKLPEVLQQSSWSLYRALITFCWLERIKSVSWVFYPAQKWRDQDPTSGNRKDSCNSWEVWGPGAVVPFKLPAETFRNRNLKFDYVGDGGRIPSWRPLYSQVANHLKPHFF